MNLVENLNLISLETTFKKDNLILFAKVYSLLKLKMNKLKEFDLTFEELNNFGILLLNEIEKWDIPKVIIYLNENFSSSLEQNKFYLHSLEYFAGNYPEFVRYYLVEIFDKVSSLLHSTRSELVKQSEKTSEIILKSIMNKDLEPFFSVMIQAIKNNEKTSEAIEKLAGCIFVQNVEYPALSVITPILKRGLMNSKTEIRRKSCVIIDNMCKLIEHPKEILPLLPILEPLIEHNVKNLSDPEARNISEKAMKTVEKIKNKKFHQLEENIHDVLRNIVVKHNHDIETEILDTFGEILNTLIEINHFKQSDWMELGKNYLPEMIVDEIYQEFSKFNQIPEERYLDEEEGENLYQGEFSLAYGALTLLNNTFLHLKKNRFYGLLGPNNCGKTTLMRAISHEQVEGFPKRDQLKTIFIEHEIKEREVGEDDKGYAILNTDLCGVDWVVDCCNNEYQMHPPVTREQVEELMHNIGFANSKKYPGMERAADAEMGITTYSGGWKMKMQLCAAVLMHADVLMLDEPTGHLDVNNIQWLKDFLNDFRSGGGSVICTSHDSSFLNEMCTHIIDFQNRKLVMFREKDNVLKKFVEKYPEKKGYFELKNDVMRFEFPDPGLLENKKSNASIIKMKEVSFQYPIRDKPTVSNISLSCSLQSRVAVIGPNGAGKSTAIKLLIGELKPTSGEIIRNNNARIAYVAQHAFYHLEKHIDKTPTQYFMWRFAGFDDKENSEFEGRKVEIKDTVKYCVEQKDLQYSLRKCKKEEESKAVSLNEILNRLENKKEKTKQYECTFHELDNNMRIWVNKEILEEMGNTNEINRFEEKLAAQSGLMKLALTSQNIEKHLLGFGIEPEQASHTLIGSLSGGQKVKIVLAASMWMRPHLLILDEPTNYLDRDGLGALTKAIEEFKGGVVIISHNREFANAVATEKWIMEKGELRREGESVANLEIETEKPLVKNDTVKDSFGNEIKVIKQENLDDKQMKKRIKDLQKEIKKEKKNGNEEKAGELEYEMLMLEEKLKSL